MQVAAELGPFAFDKPEYNPYALALKKPTRAGWVRAEDLASKVGGVGGPPPGIPNIYRSEGRRKDFDRTPEV